MPNPILPVALATVLSSGLLAPESSHAQPLSLAEAVLIAEHTDEPGIAEWRSRAEAYDQQGVAERALPDPTIRVAAANVPVRDFDPNREAMTQLQIGVRQALPRGDTLALRQAVREAEADGARAQESRLRRQIRQVVREQWLELYYWDRARDLTEERRDDIAGLADVATAIFASGRANGHDVIRVDLETAALDTRLTEINRQAEIIRAALERYIGTDAQRPLTEARPVLPAIPAPDDALAALAQHPDIDSMNARIDARSRQVDLAEQAFRPAWSIDAGYGLRGSRSDVASVGVSVQMPLFSRSERRAGVSAAREMQAAEELARQSHLLDLRRELERAMRRHDSLERSLTLQTEEVLPRARETVAAVLSAYENEQADFAELVRSELALLDAELALVRMQVDQLQARAAILYLTGDVQ